MNKHIIDYINTLSVIVLSQAIQIENQRRLLDRNADALNKCSDTIKTLMEASFGNIEIFEVSDD